MQNSDLILILQKKKLEQWVLEVGILAEPGTASGLKPTASAGVQLGRLGCQAAAGFPAGRSWRCTSGTAGNGRGSGAGAVEGR